MSIKQFYSFARPSSRYIIMDRDIALDTTLSYAAKGLYWYLYSLDIDDQGVASNMLIRPDCPSETIDTLLSELVEHGYLTKDLDGGLLL